MPQEPSVRRALRACVAALAAVLAGAGAGCHAACDPAIEANTPEVWSDGVTTGDSYETGPWSGPHLAFPGGKRWNLEHHLGAVPRHVAVYLAFEPDTRELAPCAGNTCVFCVDDRYVWLRNDTCADFWVRVEAGGADVSGRTPRCDSEALAKGDDAATTGDVAPSVQDASVDGAGDALVGAGDALLDAPRDTLADDAALDAGTPPP